MKKYNLAILLLLLNLVLQAQDLEDIVDDEIQEAQIDHKVTETYKSDRIINSISNEMLGRRELDFKIDHHFGDIGGPFGGYQSFYGLDNVADVRVSFTYGVTDRFSIGISRLKGFGEQRGLIESSLKYAIMQQSEKKYPVSITYYGTFVTATNTIVNNPLSLAYYKTFMDRVSIFSQVLISRKINERFSLSAGLAYVYNHRRYSYEYPNSLASIVGFRYKFAKRWGIIGDWYHNFLKPDFPQLSYRPYDPISIGAEIETGGHVFHICFMNNRPLSETQFIPRTTADWSEAQFRWGFKISRIFNL